MEIIVKIHDIFSRIFIVRVGDEDIFYIILSLGLLLGYGISMYYREKGIKIIITIIIALLVIPVYAVYRVSVGTPVEPISTRVILEYFAILYIFFSVGWLGGMVTPKISIG